MIIGFIGLPPFFRHFSKGENFCDSVFASLGEIRDFL